MKQINYLILAFFALFISACCVSILPSSTEKSMTKIVNKDGEVTTIYLEKIEQIINCGDNCTRIVKKEKIVETGNDGKKISKYTESVVDKKGIEEMTTKYPELYNTLDNINE